MKSVCFEFRDLQVSVVVVLKVCYQVCVGYRAYPLPSMLSSIEHTPRNLWTDLKGVSLEIPHPRFPGLYCLWRCTSSKLASLAVCLWFHCCLFFCSHWLQLLCMCVLVPCSVLGLVLFGVFSSLDTRKKTFIICGVAIVETGFIK